MSDVKPVAYFVTGMPSGEPTLCFPDETEDCDVASDGRAKFLPLYSEGTITALQAEIEAMRKDARYVEYGRVAMRFVDRAGDVHPGIDDAETICAEFHEAMSKAVDAAIAKEKQQESLK